MLPVPLAAALIVAALSAAPAAGTGQEGAEQRAMDRQAAGQTTAGQQAEPPSPAGYPGPAVYPDQDRAAVAEHLARARRLAGGDLFAEMAHRCIISPVHPVRVRGIQHDGRLQPTRLFDQFYSVGQNAVSAFALDTPGGIILFDALNSAAEARDLLVPNLRALGLDPARLRYVVVTHGHGDHYGGARYLQKTFGARVIASAADWDMMARAVVDGPFRGLEPPQRDMVAKDGETISLGGTNVRLYITPGHTPGTLSAIFPVTDNGRRHIVGFHGGTGGGRTEAALRSSIGGFDRWATLTRAAGADVVIANHPLHAQSLEREELLRYRRPGDPNPFVIGTDAFQRYVAIQSECARVQLARMGATDKETRTR